MGVHSFSCFVVFVIMLFVLPVPGLQGRNRFGELRVPGPGVDPANSEEDVLWAICWPDLTPVNADVEDLDFFIPGETSSSTQDSLPITEESIQKAVSTLDPQKRDILFDCLRKKNLLYDISGEEASSEKWYTKYLGILFGWPDSHVAPKQNLDRVLLQSIAPDPSSDPPLLTPVYSPQNPLSTHRADTLSPTSHNNSDLQPQAGVNSSPGPTAGSSISTNNQKSSRKAVVIAVVVTATVTLTLSMLLFLCYYKCRTGAGAHQNDERPLLRLSLSDFSIGSPNSYGSSPIHEKPGIIDSYDHKSHKSSDVNFYIGSDFMNRSHNGTRPSAEFPDISSNTSATVQPPPGMLPVSSSGSISLKPPPGWVELSSSKPLPKPSPGMDDSTPPPLPPRPVPPFLLKSSSRGAGRPPPGPSPPPNSHAIRPGPPQTLPPPAPPRPPPPPAPRPPPPPASHPPPPPAPRPPPPPNSIPPPRGPLKLAIGPKAARHSTSEPNTCDEADISKTKLKPFFWDKVQANTGQSMVWHHIKSGSFQFNEEMIESLFGYAPANKEKKNLRKDSSSDPFSQYIQIIESKKAQNILILLRALNVTVEEVCDALYEGSELPSELLETLLKMVPTAEEELKLRLFSGEISRLGPAERFLKVIVEVPFAFRRLECLLFMSSLQEDVSIIKHSFATLEVACNELRSSRLFLKLLEAVLKTGNRMNNGTFRGGAQAFKLDTLLKLSDVKGTDGKTTLLHFVVQEIIRSEGVRAMRASRETQSMSSFKSEDLMEDLSPESEESYRGLGLQVVSSLSAELENVQKAAILDSDGLTGNVARLADSLKKSKEFLNIDMTNTGEDNGFFRSLKSFVERAEIDVGWLSGEEKRIVALVKKTADYFHGEAGKEEGFRLFAIVRDFLVMLDKVCKEVRDTQKKPIRSAQRREMPASQTSSESINAPPSPDVHKRLFPYIADRRILNSSSDEESP